MCVCEYEWCDTWSFLFSVYKCQVDENLAVVNLTEREREFEREKASVRSHATITTWNSLVSLLIELNIGYMKYVCK